MGERTGIEWTGSTWTPIRARHRQSGKLGWHCVHMSEGCRHCYAETMNGRLGTGLPFKPGHAGDIEIILDEAMLLAPLRWRKPRHIFVCSMTDLFADFVPDAMIDRIFAVMALAPQHTFQVLTKRADRMRTYVEGDAVRERIAMAAIDIVNANAEMKLASQKWFERRVGIDHLVMPWPLRNVWAGVSAENQRRADERIPDLLATPAAIRFVSAEPLLGPLDLLPYLFLYTHEDDATLQDDSIADPVLPYRDPATTPAEDISRPALDWIIIGGESGLKARAMHPAWARGIRDQCAAAGTAFFFKQAGEFEDCGPAWGAASGSVADLEGCVFVAPDGRLHRVREDAPGGSWAVRRVGKAHAGRLLDGVEHNAMPQARS